MTWLTLQLLVGGSRARSLLVVGCTAVVTALLLLVVTLLLLPAQAEEALFDVVADPGTRPGFTFAVGLLLLLPLLLLRQAVGFGTAAREQRLAGLRLAGATPGDVRRISTMEVGLPALAGGALGVLGFFLLRLLVGGSPAAWSPADVGVAGCVDDGSGNLYCGYAGGSVDQLVPQSVVPPWWVFPVVVLGVGAVGALAGARVGRRLALSPHGVVRRRPGRAPRPWGVGLLVTAAAGLPVLLLLDGSIDDRTVTNIGLMAVVAVALVGVLSLAPWVAHRSGTRALGRTTDTAVLLAASRLVADPRPSGRAAAAVGGVGLVGGGATGTLVLLVADGQADAFYLVPLALVALCMLACLVVACGAVSLHAVEQLHDRRRAIASQVAQGVPVEVLQASLRWEAQLVALPLGAVGAALGALAIAVIETSGGRPSLASLFSVVLAILLLIGLVRLATAVTARALLPAVRATAGPDNLRTA